MRLGTRLKLVGLRRKQRKVARQFAARVRESGKTVDECSSESWYADMLMEENSLESLERIAVSDELIRQADSLYLPTPSREEKTKWEPGQDKWFPRILTAEAMTELRAAIRKEQIERRAVIEWWIKMFAGTVGILTGLIGALIGLIAISKK